MQWASIVGCGGDGSNGPGVSADPSQPPQGCSKTLCDFDRWSCTDPPDLCTQCLDTCDTVDVDIIDACLRTCDHICSKPASSTCDSKLADCRGTSRNGGCADDIFPDGGLGTGPGGVTTGTTATSGATGAGTSTGAGTIDLKKLGPDGSTFTARITQITATAGQQTISLPPGTYEWVIVTFTANNLEITRIPTAVE